MRTQFTPPALILKDLTLFKSLGHIFKTAEHALNIKRGMNGIFSLAKRLKEGWILYFICSFYNRAQKLSTGAGKLKPETKLS